MWLLQQTKNIINLQRNHVKLKTGVFFSLVTKNTMWDGLHQPAVLQSFLASFLDMGLAQLETDSASFPYNPVCPQTWSSPWAVDENVMCEFHGLVENGTCYSGLPDEVMVQKLPTCPGPTRERRINCYVLEVIKCSWVALLHQPHVYSSENERWGVSDSFWPHGL